MAADSLLGNSDLKYSFGEELQSTRPKHSLPAFEEMSKRNNHNV